MKKKKNGAGEGGTYLQLLVKTNGKRAGHTAATRYYEDVWPKFNLSIKSDFECVCVLLLSCTSSPPTPCLTIDCECQLDVEGQRLE